VSNLSSPSTCCFRVGNCTPRDTSFPCTTVLPDSDHRDPDQMQRTVQCIICKCRWLRQYSCNRSSSTRSLRSMMGHLELHKCCDLEEAFFDSPPQWLQSFFCMSCPDTRAREGSFPPPKNAVGCILHVEKREILRALSVWSMQRRISPRDMRDE
jgi:hypothetical protein